MAYIRIPNAVVAGEAMEQFPSAFITTPPGIQTVRLSATGASTTTPGIVKIGKGIAIASDATISVVGVPAMTVSGNYTALATDYYIGAIGNSADITLPLGSDGKMYIIKNQSQVFNSVITVNTTGGQKLDTSTVVNLITDASLTILFAAGRWNIIK